MKESQFLLIFLVVLAVIAIVLGLWKPLERRFHSNPNSKSLSVENNRASEAPSVSVLVSALEVLRGSLVADFFAQLKSFSHRKKRPAFINQFTVRETGDKGGR